MLAHEVEQCAPRVLLSTTPYSLRRASRRTPRPSRASRADATTDCRSAPHTTHGLMSTPIKSASLRYLCWPLAGKSAPVGTAQHSGATQYLWERVSVAKRPANIFPADLPLVGYRTVEPLIAF